MSISGNHLPHCLPQSRYEDESKSDDEFSPSRSNRNISKAAQSRLRKSGNTDGSGRTKLLDDAGNRDVNQKRDAITATSLNNLSSSSLLPGQPPLQKSEEIDELNNRLSSLEKEHEERQRHRIYQAQMAAQEIFISKHPSMRMFYVTIHSQLTGLFLGIFSLAGGLVVRNKKQSGDKVAQVFEGLGGLVPQAGALVKVLGQSLQVHQDQQQSNRMKKAANIVFDLDKGKEAAKKTAIILCELYEYQLKLLTEEGAEKLSRFACAKFLDFLTSDQLEPDLPIHKQFLMALQDNKRGITDKAKNQVARQAEKWAPTRKFFAFFGIDTEELPTHQSTKEPLYASALFSQCGIRTHEGSYYSSEINKSHVYGFRVGSEDEAVELGMTCILNPDKNLKWSPTFPKIHQLQENSLLDEGGVSDASQVLLEAANRYTKAEAAGLAALAEAETAKSLILDMSAGFVDHENRIGALEANIVIRRSSLATASKNVQEGLHAFYSTEEKGMMRLAFSQRTLDIKKSFIRLALIQEEVQKKKEERLGREDEIQKENGQLRETLLETYETIHAVKKPVELEEIFDLGKKLLLLGRAGIGKSTLCQKITQLWATEGLWNNRFDYLFWISLRNLTESQYPHGKHFLENILAGECFLPRNREGELHLVQDIREVLKDHSNQILLILDGYDEKTQMPPAIHSQLFDRQDLPAHMIVTSRPYGTEAIKHKMNATLENMGFTDQHIETYISNYFGKNPPVNVFEFIKKRRDLITMAHVPLLLEMLCLLWERKGEEIANLTMVELYKNMVEYGFERYFSRQKDLALLQQESQLIMSHAEKHRGETELSSALGKIALEGIKQGQILIDGRLIEIILRGFSDIGIKEIYGCGFLKATEGNHHEWKPGYFMHLSIQEYFAALYLATEGPNVYREEVAANKYNPYMQLVWTMCAGLLGSRRLGENDDTAGHQRVNEFFVSLHEEPRDLIGKYHNRLAISCLNACADRENLYSQIERRYKTISFLKGLIQLDLESRRTLALDLSLEFRSPSVMKYCLMEIIERLGDENWSVREAAARALGEIKDVAAVRPLIERLGNENRDVRQDAAIALGKIKDVAAVRPLIERLGDENWSVREAAAKALGEIKDVAAVRPLIERLGDENVFVRKAAARALGEIKDVAAVMLLIERLGDENGDVRWAAAIALGKIKDVAAVRPLIERLGNENRDVRKAAAIALGKIKDVAAVRPLIERLGDENRGVREAAAIALGKIKDVAAVRPLIERLDDENENIRPAAARALGEIKDVAAVMPLIERLGDENGGVRKAAAIALGEIKDVAAVRPLIERLGDERDVRQAAAIALGEIKDVAAVRPLIERLGDENGDVREAAARALGEIKDVAAVMLLIERLGDGDWHVREAAAKSLRKMDYKSLLTSALNFNQMKGFNVVVEKALSNNHPLFLRRNGQNEYDLMCGREQLLNSISERGKERIKKGLSNALSKELGDHGCIIL
ncbi:MAG: HEAT repeat domain-containing protein [Waddliaceae bacterium]